MVHFCQYEIDLFPAIPIPIQPQAHLGFRSLGVGGSFDQTRLLGALWTASLQRVNLLYEINLFNASYFKEASPFRP